MKPTTGKITWAIAVLAVFYFSWLLGALLAIATAFYWWRQRLPYGMEVLNSQIDESTKRRNVEKLIRAHATGSPLSIEVAVAEMLAEFDSFIGNQPITATRFMEFMESKSKQPPQPTEILNIDELIRGSQEMQDTVETERCISGNTHLETALGKKGARHLLEGLREAQQVEKAGNPVRAQLMAKAAVRQSLKDASEELNTPTAKEGVPTTAA